MSGLLEHEREVRRIADRVYEIGKMIGRDKPDSGRELKELATLLHRQFNDLPKPGDRL